MTTEVLNQYHKLFKLDSRKEIREWRMEIGQENGVYVYRTVAGINEGNLVESGWTIAEPTNVGRANERNQEQQTIFEVEAAYRLKERMGYKTDIANVGKDVYFKPMLATGWDKRKEKVDITKFVHIQPKLDGIRCIAMAEGLFSRTGKPITAVPHIWESLAPLFERDPNIILDGELYNHDMKDDFNKIVSAVRREKMNEEQQKLASLIQYHVYDLPSHEGEFGARFDALETLVDGLENIDVVETQLVFEIDTVDFFYSRWIEAGYEGQMIRLPGSDYENKRSNSLIKRKEFLDDEFPVVSVNEGLGNWSGYAKQFTLSLPDGREFGAGVRGNQEQMKALLSAEKPDWATVRYFTPTPDGIPRFPVVVDYGYGKREH